MADEVVIQTSSTDWLPQLARAYKARLRVVLVDDASVGVHPGAQTLFDMARHARLSPREWAAILVAIGIAGMGAWLIVMAVLDPEPYSKVFGTIVAGTVVLGTGGFTAIRLLTHHKPPRVSVSPRGFEIAWD